MLIEKKPNDLDISIEDAAVSKVIERLKDGSKNINFNNYIRAYAKRIAGKLGEIEKSNNIREN